MRPLPRAGLTGSLVATKRWRRLVASLRELPSRDCNTCQVATERYGWGPASVMREDLTQPGSVFDRVAGILAAGVVRVWGAGPDVRTGEVRDLEDGSDATLEPPEHAAISEPGGEGGETGENPAEVTHGG